jgi:F-type H+-transporting ATPase subunit delta
VKQDHATATAYAKALFSLAKERNATDAVSADLARVVELLDGEVELRRFFALPWVAGPAKRSAAVELAARLELAPLTRDFLALVAAHGRAAQLPAIAIAYRDLADEALGRVRARVRTVVPLTPDERNTLARRLRGVLGGRDVVLDEDVDARLLGGFIAESGSVVVDASLDGQLARLRQRLVAG